MDGSLQELKELPGSAATGSTSRAGTTWCSPATPSTILAGLPIVLVRQRDGSIRGFHNVCRHRGCLLVTEPQAARPLLTCRFHAWAYGLDGQLRCTPHRTSAW
jgi:phenylpropionate dioxygenase-like ring-hydroxylating dioxygenase large terminal subunit